jgi:hypothetical protein
MKSAGKYTNRRNAVQEKGLKRSQVCSYPLKITSTFPDRVILAIKEPSSSDASSSIFGKAEAKIVPISGPVKSLPVSTKALTPFSSSTEHSAVRYRIRRSFVSTIQFRWPISLNQCSSFASGAKWSSWTSMRAPARFNVSATISLPSDRSRKKIKSSSCFEDKLAPNSFFNLQARAAVVAG